MGTTGTQLWDNEKMSSISAPRVQYALDYSYMYEKHESSANTCAKEVLQLATPKIQELPDDGQGVTICEIHGFPGIDQLYDRQLWTSNQQFIIEGHIDRIRANIERGMKILAQKNGLVCNARADIPGTSLVVNISLERDLPSLWMDPNFSGISTTYTRSFLKVSLQKIPTDKIVPIPSQNSIQRTVWKIRGLLGL